jgi:hypothetical protein
MVGCPLMCTFCPQDKLKAAYGATSDKYMSLDTFKIILNKLPPHVRVDFSGMAEPWANPLATKMLEFALTQGRRTAIFTTLYGMTVEDAEKITGELLPKFQELVDIVCLHLPDANKNMQGFKPSRTYRQVLKSFSAMIGSKQFAVQKFSAMTMDGSGRVHPQLQDLVPALGRWNGHSRAGSLSESQMAKSGAIPPTQRQTSVVCASTPFYDHNVVLPNGDVLLCGMDYGRKHILGNLLTSDYYDLFASLEMNRVRVENQKTGFSKCSICKSCDNIVSVERSEVKPWHNRQVGA